MLRFPYNCRLTLLTTIGIVSCEIIKATNEFIVCNNVEYQNIQFDGKFFLEREKVCAYQIHKAQEKTQEKEEPEEKINCKILRFPTQLRKTLNA